ncbi:MAG: GYD domain-containing protein [Pseudomonadota bacterium]
MRHYMIQIRYNIASAQGLANNPQDRRPQAAVIMQKLGGRLVDFWFTFGQWDAVILVELPDDAHAMAVAISDVAGGVGETQVTPLYDMDEALEAMRIAANIDYTPPT